jgi:hypothetical protein
MLSTITAPMVGAIRQRPWLTAPTLTMRSDLLRSFAAQASADADPSTVMLHEPAGDAKAPRLGTVGPPAGSLLREFLGRSLIVLLCVVAVELWIWALTA